MIQNNFTKTTDLIHRAMDASLIRENIIANNLANQEVPNFKRSNLVFESELKKALDSEKPFSGQEDGVFPYANNFFKRFYAYNTFDCCNLLMYHACNNDKKTGTRKFPFPVWLFLAA